MIAEIVRQWDARKDVLRERFTAKHPESYEVVVRLLVEVVLTEGVLGGVYKLDAKRIHVIDDGDYQGTLIFLIGLDSYQPGPEEYIWLHNYYGSCSGCDTLKGISDYNDDPPSAKQVEEYMTLAMHMVQRMKWLDTGREG